MRKANSPLISICLATYNRLSLLARAIDSVLRQTYPQWQLIIVDDGSTDGTPALLDSYCSKDSRIVTVRQSNHGLVHARNRAASLAKGTWVTFLDSDDEYLAEHLEMRVAYFSRNPSAEFVHGGIVVKGTETTVPDIHDPSRRIPIDDCFVGGTFFIRRELFRRLGGFRQPDFGCDFDLAQRAMQLTKIHKVDFPTYVYHRDVPDSMCSRLAEKANDTAGQH